MHVEIEVLRWFAQVADGADRDRGGRHRPGQPARGLARAGPSRPRDGHPAPAAQRTVARGRPAPAVFKRHVDAMLHSLDDGYAALNELLDPETGTVTLTFQLSLGTWLVPGLIRRFRETHPRVQFRLQESDDALGSALVSGGRTDLEFTARRPDDPEVRWEHLFSQPLVLAVPPHHPLARRGGGVPERGGRHRLRDAPTDVGAARAHRRPVRGRRLLAPGGLRVRRPLRRPRVRRRRARRGGRARHRRTAGREPGARRACSSASPTAPRTATWAWPGRRAARLPSAELFQGVRPRRRPSLHVGDRHHGGRLGERLGDVLRADAVDVVRQRCVRPSAVCIRPLVTRMPRSAPLNRKSPGA